MWKNLSLELVLSSTFNFRTEATSSAILCLSAEAEFEDKEIFLSFSLKASDGGKTKKPRFQSYLLWPLP